MEIKFTLPIMVELDGKLYEVDNISMGQSGACNPYLKVTASLIKYKDEEDED